jgi:hypothetical protein
MEKETKQSAPIQYCKLKQGATDWTDEYSVNILDDKGHLFLKAQVNPYYGPEEAAQNAALVIDRHNQFN